MTFNAQVIQIFAKKNAILKSESVAEFKTVFFFLSQKFELPEH